MVYTWQFALGIFLIVAWKNATFHDSDIVSTSCSQNLKLILQSDQNNNLSLKSLYFPDYLKLKYLARRGEKGRAV